MKNKTSIRASLPAVLAHPSFLLWRPSSRLTPWLGAGAASLLLCNASIAHAQTFVPTSGTATWNLDSNWSPATIPNAVGASVVFDTPTAARTITVDSGATGFTIGSLTFNNDSAFANALQVGAAGSNLILDNGGAGVTLTFDGTGASLANQAVSIAMVFNDNVTGAVNYVANATANMATQGAFNWIGSVSGGTGGFTKTGPGGMTFGTANKQYTGPTLFDTDSGRIRISINGRPSATSSVTVKSGAMLELISNGTYSFGSGPLNLNGIGNPANPGVICPDRVADVGGRVLTISNPVVLQSDSLLHSQTIASGSNPNAITTGSITLPNVVSGPGNLAFTAPSHNQELGTLILSGANTYEGGTLVRGGTVVVGGSASASLGAGDVTVESSHAVFAGASAKLTIQTGVLNAIADTATLSLAGGNMAGLADDGFAELDSGINEFVGGLVLGGVAQGPGTYGSTASTATFQNDEFFAGTGIVTVGAAVAIVRLVSTNAVAGTTVLVPIELVALGNENALGFSLAFDISVLSFAGATLGGGASGASLIINSNDLSNGKAGFGIALPANTVFAAGTQEVLTVSFAVASVSNATSTAITFGDQPTARQISDTMAHALPGYYVRGSLSVAPQTPSISMQPLSQTVTAGTNVTFTVTATGLPPLNFQWQFNGMDISGATNRSHSLNDVQTNDAGNYSVVVTNTAGSVMSSNAVLTVNVPPSISMQPLSQIVTRGSNVTFSVVADGMTPLSYQWRFNGAEISGATDSSYSLSNVQTNDAGIYSVMVTNVAGSVMSSNAVLTVNVPPSISMQPVSQTVVSGSNVTFSVMAAGTTPFGYQWRLNGAEISGATDSSYSLSNVQTNDGGIYSVMVTNVAGSAVSSNASLTVLFPYEADAAPRPDGDYALSITDWVQVGRFVAGLDTADGAGEFQRADCAPRSALGNGVLSVTDWVQAGRYGAALDPLTWVGGPASAGFSSGQQKAQVQAASARMVKVVEATVQAGSTNEVSIELEAQGNENALGFTLVFNPAVLGFPSATLGTGAAGATLNVNTNQAGSGKLGILLALSAGNSFAAGTRQVSKARFFVAPSATGSTTVAFGDQPIFREVSDSSAHALTTGWTNGILMIHGLPVLNIDRSGTNVLLSWPVSATGFLLESADNLSSSTNWSAASTTQVTNEQEIIATAPLSGGQKFYRLKKP